MPLPFLPNNLKFKANDLVKRPSSFCHVQSQNFPRNEESSINPHLNNYDKYKKAVKLSYNNPEEILTAIEVIKNNFKDNEKALLKLLSTFLKSLISNHLKYNSKGFKIQTSLSIAKASLIQRIKLKFIKEFKI